MPTNNPDYTRDFADVYLAELDYVKELREKMGITSEIPLEQVRQEIEAQRDNPTTNVGAKEKPPKGILAMLRAWWFKVYHFWWGTAEPSSQKTSQHKVKLSTKAHLVGLALSGGGVRSATFNLGLLQSLAKNKVLQYCDYLSTVSGGGYIGSCLSSLLTNAPNASTKPKEFPLRNECDSQLEKRAEVNHLRRTKNYLGFGQGIFCLDTWHHVGIISFGVILINIIPLAILILVSVVLFQTEEYVKLVADNKVIMWLAVACILWLTVIRLRQASPDNRFRQVLTEIIFLLLTSAMFLLVAWLLSLDNKTLIWSIVALLVMVAVIRFIYRIFMLSRDSTYQSKLQLGYDKKIAWGSAILAGLLCISLLVFIYWRMIEKYSAVPFLIVGVGAFLTIIIGNFVVRKSKLQRAITKIVMAMALIVILLSLSAGIYAVLDKAKNFVSAVMLEWYYIFDEDTVSKKEATNSISPLNMVIIKAITYGKLEFTNDIKALFQDINCDDPLFQDDTNKLSDDWKKVLDELSNDWIRTLELYTDIQQETYLVGICKTSKNSPSIKTGIFLVVMVVVLILLFIGLLTNLNHNSQHFFYCDRLSKTYLIRRGKQSIDPEPIEENCPLLLKNIHTCCNGPYHLINTTLNVPSSKNTLLNGHGAELFTFSKYYCGAESTGYKRTESYDQGKTKLATAMAISGAAASPEMGANTNAAMAILMTLLNFRLNLWMVNPNCKQPAKVTLWPYYLYKEMFRKGQENEVLLNLSDGGHCENLGIYPLLKRRCKMIIASDAGADPDYQMADMANLQRKARIDLGINIDINLNDLRPNENGFSKAYFVKGTIHYPDNEEGTLLLIKTTMIGNEPEDLLAYQRANSHFPDETTADQFFDEDQFESYRKLGELAGEIVCSNLKGTIPS